MKRWSLFLGALAIAIALAALGSREGTSAGYVSGNNWERPQSYVTIDTLGVPAGGRRSIYNLVPVGETGVRLNVDSLIAGFGTFSVKKIQHLQVWAQNSSITGTLTLTVFDDRGTTRNTILLDQFVPYDFRVQCDSLWVASSAGCTLLYEVW